MTTVNPCAPTGGSRRPPATTPAAKINVPAVIISARMGSSSSSSLFGRALLTDLDRNSLHNAHDRLGGYDTVQAETGPTEKRAVFGFCAFLAAREHQHDDVLHLALMRGISRRQDRLDNQEAAVRWHDCAAVTEDGQTLLFVPV